MLKWIDEILAPYVSTAPEGVVPTLFLVSFSVHMMATIVNGIQDLGVQVEFIPPGCTGLLQPVDIGYNKAFKAKLRTEYNTWLLNQDPDQRIPATTCRNVANWIVAAEMNITDNTLKNSWRKTGYSYFGVFGGDGEFEGADAMVGDNPNEPDAIAFNELNEHASDEGGDSDIEV